MTLLLISLYQGPRFLGQDLVGLEITSQAELRAFISSEKTAKSMWPMLNTEFVQRITPEIHDGPLVDFVVHQIFNAPAE